MWSWCLCDPGTEPPLLSILSPRESHLKGFHFLSITYYFSANSLLVLHSNHSLISMGPTSYLPYHLRERLSSPTKKKKKQPNQPNQPTKKHSLWTPWELTRAPNPYSENEPEKERIKLLSSPSLWTVFEGNEIDPVSKWMRENHFTEGLSLRNGKR